MLIIFVNSQSLKFHEGFIKRNSIIILMNKRYSTIMSVAAIAVMAGALFGSTYTNTQISTLSVDATTVESALDAVERMGGLQLVMPGAYAVSGTCDELLDSGRTVVNFDLTGESHTMPMVGGEYNAMTFNGQIPGPTLRVTQGDVVHATLTIPSDEPTQHGNDMHASQMSAVPYMGAVNIGETGEYCFIAEVPGVYKYHCSGVNVAAMDNTYYLVCMVSPLLTH